MDEDINDVTDIFRSIRDHNFNEIQSDIGGLMARVRAMDDAVDDLNGVEADIQGVDWAIIPQGDEERLRRENLLIEILKIVDDGYLSAAWALRETLGYLKDEYVPESDVAESLYDRYWKESRTVMGLRIYSHHGNSLPISINDSARGDFIGDGVRRKIGVTVDEVWEKKGDDYRISPEFHYAHLESNFIHLHVLLRDHSEMAEELVDEFVEEILQENSDTIRDYQSIGNKFKELLDSGAHNRY